MPTPIIELQKSLTEIGRIRAGDRTEGGAPRRLQLWRLTSPQRSVVEEAAERYGGTPRPWKSPIGDEWEVYTEASELPIIVMPGYSLRQQYELWTGPSACERRCDGVEETISGGACICNAEEVDRCDLHTRLTVVLPELTTAHGWRLETKGTNAARELLGAMTIASGLLSGRPFVAGVLRLTERRGQKDGQATRFVVPVIDFPISWSQILAAPAVAELPPPDNGSSPDYVPIEASVGRGQGISLEEGLATVERPDARRPSGRSASPVGQTALAPDPLPIEVADDEPSPAPDETPKTSDREQPPVGAESGSAPSASEPEPERRSKLATVPMKKKMNILVGELRDDHKVIETRHLWAAMNKEPILSDDGELHWAPLREMLTRDEAHALIERLEKARDTLIPKEPKEAPNPL